MSMMVSQITNLTIVYSTIYSGADQRKHQSSASLAFVRVIHWWPVTMLGWADITGVTSDVGMPSTYLVIAILHSSNWYDIMALTSVGSKIISVSLLMCQSVLWYWHTMRLCSLNIKILIAFPIKSVYCVLLDYVSTFIWYCHEAEQETSHQLNCWLFSIWFSCGLKLYRYSE